jgi:hypothetical protein
VLPATRFRLTEGEHQPIALLHELLWSVGLEVQRAFEDGLPLDHSFVVRETGRPVDPVPDESWVPPPEVFDERGELLPHKLIELAQSAPTRGIHDAALRLALQAAPGFIVRMDQAFPADRALAQWLVLLGMCFNDVLTLHHLRPAAGGDTYRGMYLFRLQTAHLYEAALLLNNWFERRAEVRAFVESLGAGAQADFKTVRSVVRGNGELVKWVKSIRNQFFHYPGRDDRVTADLQEAMRRLSPEDGYAHYGSGLSDESRFAFADAIAIEMFTAGASSDEAHVVLKQRVVAATAALENFAHAALLTYIQRLPDDARRRARPGEERKWGLDAADGSALHATDGTS